MKIYVFAHLGGAKDWVFAHTIGEAREFYLNFTGMSDFEDCEVRSVPKKEWDSNYILDINTPDPKYERNESDYFCGYKIEETFAEYAARNTETDMISTTEF